MGWAVTVERDGKTVICISDSHMGGMAEIGLAEEELIRRAADHLLGFAGHRTARPLREWHEDLGDVMWWFFPIKEAPYVGTPNDTDWPGYHTHFTRLPAVPVPPINDPEPWFPVKENDLMGARQSGYHFFDTATDKRIAAYPGSTNEGEALQKFAADYPQYILPF